METEHRHFVERRPRALNSFIMMEHLLDTVREPMRRDVRKKLIAAAVIKGGNVLVSADDYARRAIVESFHETMKTDHKLALLMWGTFKASEVMRRKDLREFLGYKAKGRMFPKV